MLASRYVLDDKPSQFEALRFFYRFAAVSDELLNTAPSTLFQAAVQFIFLHPTPLAVFTSLPQLVRPLSDPRFKITLSADAHELVSSLLSRPDRDPGALQTTEGGLFCANWADGKLSCATRVLRLLGIDYTHLFSEDDQDVDEVGVISEVFTRLLAKVGHMTHLVTIPAPATNLVAEQHPVIDNAVTLYLYDDHVCFSLPTHMVPKPPLELHGNPGAILAEKYPLVKGRAGAKVFITTYMLNPAYSTVVGRLLYDALVKADNDWENILVCNLTLLQYFPAGCDFLHFLLGNKWVFSLSHAEVNKLFKECQLCVRMYGMLPQLLRYHHHAQTGRLWANALYGLDVLTGRSDKVPLDFQAELVMRMADPASRAVPTLRDGKLVLDEALYDLLDEQCTLESVREVLSENPRVPSFASWFARRMFWGASGGAPGATITWQDSNEKLRLNKRGALLAINTPYMRGVLDRANESVQWSTKSVKYESGKLRSILNTSVENYIVQAYLLDIFDKNTVSASWYATAHTNSDRMANHLRRLIDLKHHHALMWDFSDFNINHDFKGMCRLYNAVAETIKERSAKEVTTGVYRTVIEDITRAQNFIISARNNTYLSDNETGVVGRVVRSLQSGERGTSFTNAMRSDIDYRIVRAVCSRLLGRDYLSLPNDKLGDDVFMVTRDAREASLVCAVYNLCGFAGQISKITSDHNIGIRLRGARGEFLRYSYDAHNDIVSGYPIRALVGVVHGEFFSEPIPNPPARAATFLEQFSKLKRRGIELPAWLCKSLIGAHCFLTYTSESGKKTRVSVDIERVLTPSSLGGVGITQTEYGLASSSGGVEYVANSTGLAVCVPSGEGKTFLARRFTNLFVDLQDTLTLDEQREIELNTSAPGGESRIAQIYRLASRRSIGSGRTLLTQHPEYVDMQYMRAQPSIGSVRMVGCILETPSASRANKITRHAILQKFGKATRRFLTVRDLQATVVQMAMHANASGNGYATAMMYARPDPSVSEGFSRAKYPVWAFPRVGANSILRRAKVDLRDYAIIDHFGASREVQAVDEAILASGLTGAYPKSALYNALATYAKQLHEESFGLIKKQVTIKCVKLDVDNAIVRRLALQALAITPIGATGHNLMLRNKFGHPAVRNIRHHYGVLPRVAQLLGFSLSEILGIVLNKASAIPAGPLVFKLIYMLNDLGRATLNSCNVNEANDTHRQVNSLLTFLEGIKGLGKSADAYLEGAMELLPPFNPGVNGELISLARDITLLTIEECCLDQLLTLPRLEACVAVNMLERHVLAMLLATYNTVVGPVILVD